MSTERQVIEVGGVAVEVARKNIRNLHLRVYPPDGRVRMSAPFRLEEQALRRFVTSRLDWILRKREDFERREPQPELEMITGEMHSVQGQRYRLEVIERNGSASVSLAKNACLLLHVRPGTSSQVRRVVLENWYRQLLRAQIPQLIARWEPRISVTVAQWRIKKMTTRWGTCNPRARRIWINLELAKRPAAHLEYIVVHEMVHMLERLHDARFRALMDQFLPQWRQHQAELKRIALPR